MARSTGSASLMADFGANATWTDGHGHYVQVFGAKTGDTTLDAEAGFVQVEQILDTHHWTRRSVPLHGQGDDG